MGILKSDDKLQAALAHGTYNAILDQGSEFEGKLTFEGTVRIDGVYKGEIVADATLIVGETGKVYADVRVRTAVISGEVVGNVEASEKVELNAPGILRGNIKTPNLVIEEGVVFEGSCNMTAASVPSHSHKSGGSSGSGKSDHKNETKGAVDKDDKNKLLTHAPGSIPS